MISSSSFGRRWFDAALIAVALVGLWHVVQAVTLMLPTRHVDGAFQTASALFRLDGGQFPGRDFSPYLGLAATYVPFPLFKAAGADLAASATAAYIAVMLASAGTVTLVMRLIAPRIGSARVLVVAIVAMPLALGFAKSGYSGRILYELIIGQVEPGNSLRPLRSFAPYLSAALLLLVLARVAAPATRCLLFGAVGGFVLWWSNDYGPPAAAMAAAVMAADLTLARRWTIANVAAGAAGAICAIVATVGVLTAFRPLPFLRYIVAGVGRDQWWYYGPWLPGERLFALADLRLLLTGPHVFATAVLTILSVHVVRTRRRGEAMLALTGWALFAGGMLATAGGHLELGYFSAVRWWSFLVVAGYAARAFWSWLEPKRVGALVVRRGSIALGAAVVLFAAGAVAAHTIRQDRLARDPALYREDRLGGYLPVDWRAFLARAKAPGQEAIEEYWGLWSAVRRENRGRVDSAIHALGDERAAFGRLIAARPPLLISSRPWATWGYQGWSMSVNWWFWGPLLKDYRIAAVSPRTFLWTRSPRPDWASVPCRVSPDRKRVFIDRPGNFFELRIAYRVEPAPRRLLMARNGLGQASGWFPLDPAATRARFPVLRDADAMANGIRFMTLPVAPGGPRMAVHGCAASRIPVTPDVRASFPLPPGSVTPEG